MKMMLITLLLRQQSGSGLMETLSLGYELQRVEARRCWTSKNVRPKFRLRRVQV